ncbi:hypothetical protein [Pelagibius sp.]|uniref:hypothetical protein n=1 Tax=Pelagibius sp. TaxID=1931238 RepID=UPI002604C8C7|nr:hypothetical protein [Pelagibius sp.]
MDLIGPVREMRRPPSKDGLPRDLTGMLIGGPLGGSDPVLWTLLLHNDPAQDTPTRQSDRCAKPSAGRRAVCRPAAAYAAPGGGLAPLRRKPKAV